MFTWRGSPRLRMLVVVVCVLVWSASLVDLQEAAHTSWHSDDKTLRNRNAKDNQGWRKKANAQRGPAFVVLSLQEEEEDKEEVKVE